MSAWAGFTDDELKRLKGKPDGGSGVRRQLSGGKPRASPQRKVIIPQNRGSVSNTQEVMPPEQRLFMPPNNNNKENVSTEINKTSERSLNESFANKNSTCVKSRNPDDNGNVLPEKTAKVKQEETVNEVKELELDQSEALNLELSKLEKFQQQQKMIEELNKQRKQLLSKAISERSKRAKAEASKLNHIEKELSHLDHLLTADVSVIRDRIEEASLAFMTAQKRYEKAEKEYVDAKIYLHEKAELKEQLTEHLYTIIHQNEVRKSQKLSALMKQLEMEVDMEGIEVGLVDLPPLTSFNTVHTLSPTHSPKSPPVTSAGKTETSEHPVISEQPVSNPESQKPNSDKKAEEEESESQGTLDIKNHSNEKSDSVSLHLTHNSPDLIPGITRQTDSKLASSAEEQHLENTDNHKPNDSPVPSSEADNDERPDNQ